MKGMKNPSLLLPLICIHRLISNSQIDTNEFVSTFSIEAILFYFQSKDYEKHGYNIHSSIRFFSDNDSRVIIQEIQL